MSADQSAFSPQFLRAAAVQQATLAACASAMDQAAAALIACYHAGGKALFCGNGGSAAQAQHLAAEFVGRFLKNRRALPALALHSNGSTLSAIGNDYGYEHSFARPVEAFARSGDVVVGLSTSGNSPNVAAALTRGRELGCTALALTGEGGGKMSSAADILIAVPSRETPRIQECHLLIGHCLCQAVEEALFGA